MDIKGRSNIQSLLDIERLKKCTHVLEIKLYLRYILVLSLGKHRDRIRKSNSRGESENGKLLKWLVSQFFMKNFKSICTYASSLL